MTRDLGTLWKAIDEDPAPDGLIRRRVDPESPYDLFLIEARPSRIRSFRAEFREEPGTLWRSLEAMKGIECRVVLGPDSTAIDVVETDGRYHEVFNALVGELLDGLRRFAAVQDADKGVALDFLAGRIIRWRNCFKLAPEGMGTERQLGLFGELWVLQSLMDNGIPALESVAGWKGPDRAPQDFQLRGSSVEVKASRQAKPVSVRISSERQLDHSADGPLFLVHCAVDVRSDGSGVSLPAFVERLRDLVGRQSDAGILLDDSLMTYGYLDVHAPRYVSAYNVRYVDCFEVSDSFPRIRESDLDEGIGEVSYSLALSACEPHRVDLETAIGRIVGVGA